MRNGIPIYTKKHLPDAPDGAWKRYRKLTQTVAGRHEGPFECVTSEGNVAKCDDGYLAIDTAGYPYPVNKEEFERTYEPVDPDQSAEGPSVGLEFAAEDGYVVMTLVAERHGAPAIGVKVRYHPAEAGQLSLLVAKATNAATAQRVSETGLCGPDGLPIVKP